MAKLPFLQFFPTNWRSDPALAMCSEGARLLWFEMLLVMHEAEPRGFLVVNGKAPDPRQIAMLTRTDPALVDERLAELEQNGVFSRNGRGVIYSRKMCRDEKKAQTARKNGASGGNPNLRKQTPIPPSDNLNGPEPLSPKTPDASVASLHTEEETPTPPPQQPSPAPAREETAPAAPAAAAAGDPSSIVEFCQKALLLDGANPAVTTRTVRTWVGIYGIDRVEIALGKGQREAKQRLVNYTEAVLEGRRNDRVATVEAAKVRALRPAPDPIIDGTRASLQDFANGYDSEKIFADLAASYR